jgi:hypothetical protein
MCGRAKFSVQGCVPSFAVLSRVLGAILALLNSDRVGWIVC